MKRINLTETVVMLVFAAFFIGISYSLPQTKGNPNPNPPDTTLIIITDTLGDNHPPDTVYVTEAYQCLGLTKEGKQCKHRTRNPNRYCYQHQAQVPR